MSEFVVDDDNECAIYVNTKHCTPINVLNNLSMNIARRSFKDPLKAIEVLKEKTNCDSELCVIKSSKTSSILGKKKVHVLLSNFFKIEGPKLNIEKWLSNDDIDKTLEQWSKHPKFSTFYHVQFQMRDFEQNNTELAKLNFLDIYNQGYRSVGCVLNTDWSSGNGQHWFAFYFDFNKEPFTLEYFNSSGEYPLKEFNSWLNDKEQQLRIIFDVMVKKIIVTTIQNQYDNSSCGCYALYYIYSRLNGVPWIWFRKYRVPDKKMHRFRRFLFNNYK